MKYSNACNVSLELYSKRYENDLFSLFCTPSCKSNIDLHNIYVHVYATWLSYHCAFSKEDIICKQTSFLAYSAKNQTTVYIFHLHVSLSRINAFNFIDKSTHKAITDFAARYKVVNSRSMINDVSSLYKLPLVVTTVGYCSLYMIPD